MTSSDTFFQRKCGDINLVAALMSVGIPLDPDHPVCVVDSTVTGGSYGSYGISEAAEDGKVLTEDCMKQWNGGNVFPVTHGFSRVCEFIRARPRGCKTTADLMTFAMDYLKERQHHMPGLKRLEDIPAYVSSLPSGEASYVLAYVFNREVCYQLYCKASRRVHMSEGSAHVILDTKLPKHVRQEFLSRLQG